MAEHCIDRVLKAATAFCGAGAVVSLLFVMSRLRATADESIVSVKDEAAKISRQISASETELGSKFDRLRSELANLQCRVSGLQKTLAADRAAAVRAQEPAADDENAVAPVVSGNNHEVVNTDCPAVLIKDWQTDMSEVEREYFEEHAFFPKDSAVLVRVREGDIGVLHVSEMIEGEYVYRTPTADDEELFLAFARAEFENRGTTEEIATELVERGAAHLFENNDEAHEEFDRLFQAGTSLLDISLIKTKDGTVLAETRMVNEHWRRKLAKARTDLLLHEIIGNENSGGFAIGWHNPSRAASEADPQQKGMQK